MLFFTGTYMRQLDDRGRFILPSKVREKLSGTVYITKAPFSHNLNLYTVEEWEEIARRVRMLPSGNDIEVARFTRRLFSSANECEIDKQGRIPLTPLLIEAASLKKDIVLAGANNKFEIWSSELWQAESEDIEDNSSFKEALDKYEIIL